MTAAPASLLWKSPLFRMEERRLARDWWAAETATKFLSKHVENHPIWSRWADIPIRIGVRSGRDPLLCVAYYKDAEVVYCMTRAILYNTMDTAWTVCLLFTIVHSMYKPQGYFLWIVRLLCTLHSTPATFSCLVTYCTVHSSRHRRVLQKHDRFEPPC